MQTTASSFGDIIASLRAGNEPAERLVYQTFEPRVRAFLRRRLRDDEAIAEVTNDVLHVAITSMRAGDVRSNDALPAFVLGVARNLANNYIRSRRAAVRHETLTDDVECSTESWRRSFRERFEAAHDAIISLDEIDKTILLLILCRGLTPTQIGVSLGLSAEVVRARKSRAIKRLLKNAEADLVGGQ